jgi:hypothetical protein
MKQAGRVSAGEILRSVTEGGRVSIILELATRETK